MNQAIRVGTCEEAESSIKEVIQPQVPSTATLLRLHPSHESHRGNRPPEG